MNIAIYGAGSLGTVLGAYLTKAGLSVDLINRNEAHVNALKSNGARIRGTVEMDVKVNALLPSEVTKKYDVVFLLTKVIDNKETVKSIVPILSDNGIICTLQNGLPEGEIAEIIGAERTYGCAIGWGATMKAGGECELTSNSDALFFNLGGIDNDGSKLGLLSAVLGNMGQVIVEKNFIGARWSKLLINSGFSGMGAVLGTTFGGVSDNKQARLCAQRILKECIDVTKAAGVKMEPVQGKDISALFDYNSKFKQKLSFFLIPVAIKKHRAIKPSMLQDIEKGKKCEIGALNGTVSTYGKKYGVPTPYNDKVVETVTKIEQGKLTPSMSNLAFFKPLAKAVAAP
jgi:2-dehydropantoate 2-reductase